MMLRALVAEQDISPMIDCAIGHDHIGLQFLAVPRAIIVALKLADPDAWLGTFRGSEQITCYENSILFGEIDSCFMSERIIFLQS